MASQFKGLLESMLQKDNKLCELPSDDVKGLLVEKEEILGPLSKYVGLILSLMILLRLLSFRLLTSLEEKLPGKQFLS